MSFTSQLTTCQLGNDLTMVPTRQEQQLSELVRPGMTGGGMIHQILLPEKYVFEPFNSPHWRSVAFGKTDVTERRKHLVRRPKLVRFENVTWRHYQGLSWTAYLSNTAADISVPIDYADDAGLGYYNCRLLRSGDVISLGHRSIITDFSYRDDYFDSYVLGILGSSFIEQHEFAHVDTPLDHRSGYLVLGKANEMEQTMELTAFAVNPGDTVYIPAKTIHTNDYFLGRWRTLLSSSCEFPNAQIRRPGDKPLRFVYGHNK